MLCSYIVKKRGFNKEFYFETVFQLSRCFRPSKLFELNFFKCLQVPTWCLQVRLAGTWRHFPLPDKNGSDENYSLKSILILIGLLALKSNEGF